MAVAKVTISGNGYQMKQQMAQLVKCQGCKHWVINESCKHFDEETSHCRYYEDAGNVKLVGNKQQKKWRE